MSVIAASTLFVLFSLAYVTASPEPVLAACPVVHPFGNVTDGFDDDANAIDALWMLRDIAGFQMPSAYCGPVDIDCSGKFDAVDALKVLRYTVSLSYTQTPPCPRIGEYVSGI